MKIVSMKFILIFNLMLVNALAEVDPRFEHSKLANVFSGLNFEKTEKLLGSWKMVGESYQKGLYQMSRINPNGLGTMIEINLVKVLFSTGNDYEVYEISSDLFTDFGGEDYPRYSCKYQKLPFEAILCNGFHGSGRTSFKCFVREEILSEKSCLFP